METQVNSQSTCHLHSLLCIALDQCPKFDFASQWLKRSSEILPNQSHAGSSCLEAARWGQTQVIYCIQYIYYILYIHQFTPFSLIFFLSHPVCHWLWIGFLYIIIIYKHVHCPFCAHFVIVWHMVLICFSKPPCVSISEVQTMFSIDFWYLHTYNISILFLFSFPFIFLFYFYF